MHTLSPTADEPPIGDLLPVTLPIVPPASLSTAEQVVHLILELDKLNIQTDQLIRQQPSIGRVYQQQLAERFPQLHLPINPNQIFYSRYREDQQEQPQLLSSEPLGALLNRLRSPGADAYLNEASGAFYRERNTLDTDKRLSPIGSTETLASVLEVAITISLNTFWGTGQNNQPNPQTQLVAARRQVLAHQLALRSLDGTLSAEGREMADTVLKYPSDAAREQALAADNRPGVYRLTLDDGSEFAGAFILSATGATAPTGRVMLYSPGEEFEEYENLERLNETVAARLAADGPAGKRLTASLPVAVRIQQSGVHVLAARPVRISADLIADSVHSLRVRQYYAIRQAIREEVVPQSGELDLAADLTSQLDVADALTARNLRLVEAEPGWLKTASVQDQALYKQLDRALLDSSQVLIALLENISPLEAFAAAETDKVLKTQKPIYADTEIDPYRSLVHLRASTELSSRSAQVQGYRDESNNAVYVSEDPKINIPQFLRGKQLTLGTWRTTVLVDLRTLSSYTRRNIEPFSVSTLLTNISATADIFDTAGVYRGKLGNGDLRALAQEANIGQKYDTYLRTAFAQNGAGSTFATAWQNTCAAQMNKDALECRLNPDAHELFTFHTPGSGLDWIKTIAQYPDSATRPQVSGHEIQTNLLVMGGAQARGQGGQVINRVLVINRKGTKPDGVSVLYTPDAPDGMPFRELANGLADLDRLKANPQWQAYFRPRMATSDTQEITRIFNDIRGAHRYALTPIIGNFHAYQYSAQLGFQLAHADFRSRSNAQISRESAVNAFMLGANTADFLIGLMPGKSALSLLRRAIYRGLGQAKRLGRRIPGLVGTVAMGKKAGLALGSASIRPLEPAWVDVVPYRLPEQIDSLFDVDAFARKHRYKLSRETSSAPYFFDKHNNQFIAMRDPTGRYHLYPSYVENRVRYVKDPAGNSVDYMVVPADPKGWKPSFERNAIGGGSVLDTLRTTPEQQVDADLLAAMQVYGTEPEMRIFEDVLKQTSASRKLDLITRAREKVGTNLDETEFRRWVAGPQNLRPADQLKLRTSLLMLRFDLAAYEHIHRATRTLKPPLSEQDKDELFKRLKRLIGRNDNFVRELKTSVAIIDPDTGAQFVGFAITNKHQSAMEKFVKKYELETWEKAAINAYVNEPTRQALILRKASDQGITFAEMAHQFLRQPDINAQLKIYMKDVFKKKLADLQVTSYSEDFKKSGIPYIAMSRGTHGADMVDSRTITQFENTLPRFSTPLEFEPPRVQTHRTDHTPTRPTPPGVPEGIPTRDPAINVVKLDELVNTQKAILPENAKAKLEHIIEDIEAGRVSRKKIANYTYVDLPQVEAGAGRGRWRVAVEQNGKEGGKNVYIIRGIFDYHGSRHTAWGV